MHAKLGEGDFGKKQSIYIVSECPPTSFLFTKNGKIVAIEWRALTTQMTTNFLRGKWTRFQCKSLGLAEDDQLSIDLRNISV